MLVCLCVYWLKDFRLIRYTYFVFIFVQLFLFCMNSVISSNSFCNIYVKLFTNTHIHIMNFSMSFANTDGKKSKWKKKKRTICKIIGTYGSNIHKISFGIHIIEYENVPSVLLVSIDSWKWHWTLFFYFLFHIDNNLRSNLFLSV